MVRPGWSNQALGAEYAPPSGAFGVVVSQNFPDPELLKRTLREGLSRQGGKKVWVCLNEPKANHASRFVAEVFEEFEIEPLYAPLVPAWKGKQSTISTVFRTDHLDECEQDSFVVQEPRGKDYDLRAARREAELRATCERIIVFHDINSQSTADWLEYVESWPCRSKIMVVAAGKAKPKKRTKRKPVGA